MSEGRPADTPCTSAPRYLVWTIVSGLAAFAVLWMYVAAVPMAFLDDEYPRWAAKRELLESCRIGPTLLLGDSRAATDVVPRIFGQRTVTNAALAGTTAIEAEAALRRALACPTPPRRIVLSISPGHFPKVDTFWTKSTRYRFLKIEDLRRLQEAAHATGDFSVFTAETDLELPPWLRIWLHSARFPALFFSSLFKGALASRYLHNMTIYRQVLAAEGQYSFRTTFRGDVVGDDATMRHFTVSPLIDRYMRMLIAEAASRGVPVYFLPMPVNGETARALPPALMQEFRGYLGTLEKEYRNFTVFGPTVTQMPDDCFNDPLQHLTHTGAERFSELLRPSGVMDAARMPSAALLDSLRPP